jgi:hypothetical protein
MKILSETGALVNRENGSALDLLSTSQTNSYFPTSKQDEKLHDFTGQCIYLAPIICVPPKGDKIGYLYQSCCNHWDCPRCGQVRAKHEYGRIVEGCRTLSKQYDLFFITLTCRGRDLTLADAEDNYLLWTNRLLTNWRAHVNRSGGHWCYVALTERQPGRDFPHSHMITTFDAFDGFNIVDDYPRYCASVLDVGVAYPEMRYKPEPIEKFSMFDLWSTWFVLACAKAGLGVQARISQVDNPEATAKYVSKYMFKQLGQDAWPAGWRRVRYSRNFPKLSERVDKRAFPIVTRKDWQRVERIGGSLVCENETIYLMALARRIFNVTY